MIETEKQLYAKWTIYGAILAITSLAYWIILFRNGSTTAFHTLFASILAGLVGFFASLTLFCACQQFEEEPDVYEGYTRYNIPGKIEKY
jgi:hypothetical protein